MKRFASLLAVLLCVSAVQGQVVNVYDFDSLTTGYINGKSGDNVTWQSIANPNTFRVVADPNDASNKYADSNQSADQEQTVGTMTDPNAVGSIFNLTAVDTQLRISFVTRMNYAAGGMIGIWVDGIDPLTPNTMTTNNAELALQFGMSGGQWRVRGANSATSVFSAEGMSFDPGVMPWYKLILDVDLAGNGSMSLTVVNLDTSDVTLPTELQNVSMGLAGQHPWLGDPTKWTSWWFRGQQAASAENPAACPYGYTMDDLTLEIIPEPAALSLLALGGLACIRRRMRSGYRK